MVSAAALFHLYREQVDLDINQGILLLLEFLATYGVTDHASNALCHVIDEAELTDDFANLLKENGLVTDGTDLLEGDDSE